MMLTLALAQAANPYLDEARQLARELKFSDAIGRLRVARQVADLDKTQRIEVLELLAKCHVAEGNKPEAEGAFSELLSLEPEHELDRESTSPKILTVFDDVKRQLFPEQRVTLVEEAAPPGRFRARLVDPFKRVSAVLLMVRTGEGPWAENPVPLEGHRLDVPTPLAPTLTVSWYLQATDAAGAMLATIGSAEAPRVTEAAPRPIITSPTPRAPDETLAPTKVASVVTAAVALIAVGVGTGLQLNAQGLERAARDRSRPPGDWADTARATHAEAVTQAQWSIGLFAAGGVAALSATVLFAW
ncbi:MAG: hypothetical protein Q8N26_07490 [Myxococcales bacterium]|nr:hypothetical protein [Myxococcales bacterium]